MDTKSLDNIVQTKELIDKFNSGQNDNDENLDDDEQYAHNEKLKAIKCYEVFCLRPGSSKREVKKRYNQLLLLFHPDKNKEAVRYIQVSLY